MSTLFVKYGDQGHELVSQVLAQMPLDAFVRPGLKVAIKPNLVLPKPSSSGATTDPQIVAGIIEFLQSRGCSDITVMEGSGLGESTDKAFQVCGYQQLRSRYGVRLLNLKKDATMRKRWEDLELTVCKSPLEADLLINVPVLKAHCQTKLTCALKNLKGCIPDSEKRRYHSLGLHRPIAALNRLLPQHIVVVDGLIGDLTFEEGGTPVVMNRVIGGTDPVAVDTYCAELIGLDPADVPYVGLAESFGVGQAAHTTEMLNRGAEAVATPKGNLQYLKRNIQENQACSMCLGSLVHALHRMRYRITPSSIYIGQGYRGKTQPGLGVGDCTKGFASFVPGCPPSARQIMQALSD